jgi:L,D-peptidoglycan transpeptidase YkuD (ErfK/YbiS/YcfS/YnhG family)
VPLTALQGRVVRDGSHRRPVIEPAGSAMQDAPVRARRLLLLAAIVGLLPLAGVTAASPAAAYPTTANQLITVRTSSPTATVGLLRAYDRVNGAWKLRIGPVTARVGAAGIGQASEGSTRTPAGDWRMTEAFGRQSDPGTKMSYFKADRYDWWGGDSTKPTYNRHVRSVSSPGPGSENLYYTGAAYDYAAVIGYNLEQVPGAGSAFFLHVSNGTPTLGCVAVSKTTMVQLLRWMDPAKNPWIRIGVY